MRYFATVGLEELVCSAQSADLNPTEHHQDELERRLHLRPPHMTSVVAEWKNMHSHTPKCSGTPSHKSGVYYNSNGSLSLSGIGCT